MTETITIRLREVDGAAAQALIEKLRSKVGSEAIKTSVVGSFDGTPEVLIFISAAAVALKQVGPVITAWLNRHAGKKFKAKQFEVTGYSADELLEILRKYNRDEP